MQKLIEDSYKAHLESSYNYRKQAEKVRRLEYGLQRGISDLYFKGMIDGKNAETRKAQEFELLPQETDELEKERRAEAELFIEKEQTEIQLEYARAMLRVHELAGSGL